MEAALLLALAFAVNKTVTVIKALTSKDRNTAVTQVLVWIVGTIALIVAAHSQAFGSLVVPGFTASLDSLDGASLALIGWVLGSTGSFAFDLTRAKNPNEPSLLPLNVPGNSSGPPPPDVGI